MRINFGDLLEVKTGIIVHGCNAQGVMGSGVAQKVRMKYPKAFETYRSHLLFFREGAQNPTGSVDFCRVDDGLIIANAVTQTHYGREPGKRYVSYKAMDECFQLIAEEAFRLKYDVHFPLIGCQLGGGDWSIVSDIIKQRLDGHDPDFTANLWLLD